MLSAATQLKRKSRKSIAHAAHAARELAHEVAVVTGNTNNKKELLRAKTKDLIEDDGDDLVEELSQVEEIKSIQMSFTTMRYAMQSFGKVRVECPRPNLF